MSAAHQLKKVRAAKLFTNWGIGKRRTVEGVVYATQKDARMARNMLKSPAGEGMKSVKKLERRLRMKNEKLLKETNNGREEADRTAA